MKVLVLEPIGSGAALVDCALRLAWQCYILSFNKDDRKLPLNDTWKQCQILEVDTNDEEKVFTLLDSYPVKFDAIVSGNEYYVPLSIKLTHRYSLNGLALKLQAIAHDKFAMRKFLQSKKIRNAFFTSVANANDILNLKLNFPCVIKPKDAAGSYHVYKAYSKEELLEYYELIQNETHRELGHTIDREVLIEEYLQMPEYSVEGYFNKKQLHIASITKKFLSAEPYFAEIGHLTPSSQMNVNTKEEICSYVTNLLAALEVDCGVFHCEIRFNAENLPVLIEIGFRLPGDKIVDLVKLSTNIDLAEAMLCSYANIAYTPKKHSQPLYAGVAFSFDAKNLKDYRDRKEFFIFSDANEEYVLEKMKEIWAR